MGTPNAPDRSLRSSLDRLICEPSTCRGAWITRNWSTRCWGSFLNMALRWELGLWILLSISGKKCPCCWGTSETHLYIYIHIMYLYGIYIYIYHILIVAAVSQLADTYGGYTYKHVCVTKIWIILNYRVIYIYIYVYIYIYIEREREWYHHIPHWFVMICISLTSTAPPKKCSTDPILMFFECAL